MGRRRRSGGQVVVLALYWLSGVAFLVEPFRWWARSARNSRARREAAVVASRRREVESARLAVLRAQTVKAEQEAWAVAERRERDSRAVRPVRCSHCRSPIQADVSRCGHCGAPKEAA